MSCGIYDYIEKIEKPDEKIYNSAREHFDRIAKPIGSFGKFEDIICKICSIQNSVLPHIQRKAIVVFCADNGIVENKVAQTDQSVTLKVFSNIANGKACINRIAQYSKADVFAVDSGINSEVFGVNAINKKIGSGTRNFINNSAMAYEDAEKSLLYGFQIAEQMKNDGYELCAAGEMGIGNTTTSSAVVSCLLSLNPCDTTGRGAGLSDEAYKNKIKCIEDGIEFNKPNKDDVIDVLAKVGGYDIAQMCGFFVGCSYFKIPCVLDGYIALTAALCCVKLNSVTKDYLIPSHKSSEKGVRYILDYLKFEPILDADMHQGEGTGAAMILPLLDMCSDVYCNQETFENIKIKPYERYGDNS